MKPWEQHGLNREEYQAIIEVMGRQPNQLELALFGAMWSEHCSYKHTRSLIKELPCKGSLVVQGPGENAGVIDAGDGIGVAFKIESHNHPSAIDPFQGAATGVGGILRDVVSMGARPIALANSLRLGPLDSERTRWLLKGVVRGMAEYGNIVGVPTIAGEVQFDDSYDNNPLVNAMCIGTLPLNSLKTGLATGPGNRVLTAGAPTGREGIGGAAFASMELLDETSPEIQTMQVADPAKGRNLMEACLELLDDPDIVGIQDMGAAGLTSSSCEMAFRGDSGIELELSQVPVKEEGMSPVELLLSETQERMLLVVKPCGVKRVQRVFQAHGLEAADIGKVTLGKDLVLFWQGQEVGRVPAAALADRVPLRTPAKQPPPPTEDFHELLPCPDCNRALLDLLASPNVSTRAALWQRFGELNSRVIRGPGGGAGLIGLPDSKKGIAVAIAGNSSYCALNPREGARRAVVDAARSVACTGARPAAVTNCLNFPSPEVPEQYWALAESVQGMAEACRALGTPVVSGNVSLYNEGEGIAIKPTPVIGMVGLLDEAEKAFPIALKQGQILMLLGNIHSCLGGSEYLRLAVGNSYGPTPVVDLELEAALCRLVPAAISQGLVLAAHDVGRGGIAVTLVEMALAAELGLEVEVPADGRGDYWLFSETPGVVVAALWPEQLPELRELATREMVPLSPLGRIVGSELVLGSLVKLPLAQLAVAWKGKLPQVFGDE